MEDTHIQSITNQAWNRAGNKAGSEAGFTLIELLTVLAIMGLLTALLLPSLAGVLRQVRSLQCLNNSRQWSTATWMYGEDHQDMFPYEGHFLTPIHEGSNLEAWYNVVPPYAGSAPLSECYLTGRPPEPGNRSLFVCPEVRPGEGEVPTLRKPVFMYGMNNRMDPNGPGRFRRAQVRYPAATVVFTETRRQRFPSAAGRYTLAPHGGRANLAFADGHAAAVLSNDFVRTRAEDRESKEEWKVSRKIYWYPFAGAPR